MVGEYLSKIRNWFYKTECVSNKFTKMQYDHCLALMEENVAHDEQQELP